MKPNRILLLFFLMASAPARAEVDRLPRSSGIWFLDHAPACPSGQICIRKPSPTRLTLQGAAGVVTELVPGFAQAYPPSPFSLLGAEVRLQAGIDSGTEFLRISPRDGAHPPWSCGFGVAPNAPGPDSDAQVFCGWNNAGPLNDPTKVSFGWNQENYCAEGTGCPDWSRQAEWYDRFTPPWPAGVAVWLPNHLYAEGDRVTNGGAKFLCIVGGTSAGSGGPTTTTSPGYGNITDGTAHWRYIAGFRARTFNFRLSDGALSHAMVGDSACLGYGHDINDANMICAGANGSRISDSASTRALQVDDLQIGFFHSASSRAIRFFDYIPSQFTNTPIIVARYDGGIIPSSEPGGGGFGVAGVGYKLGHSDNSGHPDQNVRWQGNFTYTQFWDNAVHKPTCNGPQYNGDAGEGTLFYTAATAGVRGKLEMCMVSDAGIGAWVLIKDGGP